MTQSLPDFDVSSIDLSEVDFLRPPSSNTGGNSIYPPPKTENELKSSQKCKIDYLSFSSLSLITKITDDLMCVIPDMKIVPSSRGWNGFNQSAQIYSYGETVGLVAWGAKTHARCYVSISGAGCKQWSDWHVELMRAILVTHAARITRIDLALDFYKGEVTYEDVEASLEAGEFQVKGAGRKPCVERHASSGQYGNKGRTIYVGSSASTKRICIYEKGLEQFGKLPAKWLENQTEESVSSYRLDGSVGVSGDVSVLDWVRAEVRYSNDDRDLDVNDYDMLIERDRYFAGAYQFCARVLKIADGLRPTTLLTETEADIEKMILNAKTSYGSLVHSMRKLGKTDSEIVAAFDAGFDSKRLIKAGYLRHLESIVPF